MRGAEWLVGQDEASWCASQQVAAACWAKLQRQREDGTSNVRWDSHLVACLDVAIQKATGKKSASLGEQGQEQKDSETVAQKADTPMTPFKQYYKDSGARSAWTVVHGDCHPGNAMLSISQTPSGTNASLETSGEQLQVRLIDFEMVGVGSPAQELGQWMISHMDPEIRRGCERRLVSNYHQRLTTALREKSMGAEADAFTFEVCWEEYVAGGAGRWAWFVPFLLCQMPHFGAQFFHDQLAAFLHDHIPDPCTMGPPRV